MSFPTRCIYDIHWSGNIPYIYIYIYIIVYIYIFKIIYIYTYVFDEYSIVIQIWYTVYCIYIHCMEGLSFSLYIYIYICFGWIFKCIIYNIRINPTSICKYIYIWYPPWNLPFWHIHEMVGSKGGYLTYTLRVLYIYIIIIV